MAAHAKFNIRLEFSQLPNDWPISNVAVDWSGEPLLLAEEGKPAYYQIDASTEAYAAWVKTPPRARHLIYWEGLSRRTLTFEDSTRVLTNHVQPFGEGWLLCDGRGGRADVFDRQGRAQRTLDLGDAIEDVQTTAGGKIWVSYFDEGVYGSGLQNQQGVLCFNQSGEIIFKYFDFAKKHDLPFVDDCYAMNVPSEDEVWLCYYSAFPLVAITNFQMERVWENFGCVSGAFGLIDGTVVFRECATRQEDFRLWRRTLAQSPHSELLEPVDEEGRPITGRFRTAGRGSRFYLWTEVALYELALL